MKKGNYTGTFNDTIAMLYLNRPKPTFAVKEEFVVYDIGSFLADCAGMGGIMLGASVLALYDWMWKHASIVRKLRTKLTLNSHHGAMENGVNG